MGLNEKPLISVIVPVYNVEPYIRKSLDSIIGQTYENLEIIVIDDGSMDGSGKICDEYKKDERIKVFHTENRGLSAARNRGLDEAKGEWIGFVDSDDWIEPDMYEALLDRALESVADVVECGFYCEYINRTEEDKRSDTQMMSIDAVEELLNRRLSDTVWNKLWKSSCYEHIRFLEQRIFEEIATTYRIFLEANCINSISSSKYHYLQREKSLSKSHGMRSLVGYWLSHKERFDGLYNQVGNDAKQKLLEFCARAITRTWAYYYSCPAEDRKSNQRVILEMSEFAKKQFPLFG